MIFEEPKFNPGGDRFIEMELGDEMSFDLNFLVHSVSGLIRESRTKGIIEIVPELTSIMISYVFEQIGYGDVAVTKITAPRSLKRSGIRRSWYASTGSAASINWPRCIPAPIIGWRRSVSIRGWSRSCRSIRAAA